MLCDTLFEFREMSRNVNGITMSYNVDQPSLLLGVRLGPSTPTKSENP